MYTSLEKYSMEVATLHIENLYTIIAKVGLKTFTT